VGTDEHGVPNVEYSPGGYAAILTTLGIGISRHFSIQAGFSVARYQIKIN
jgi:hypothetical protein